MFLPSINVCIHIVQVLCVCVYQYCGHLGIELREIKIKTFLQHNSYFSVFRQSSIHLQLVPLKYLLVVPLTLVPQANNDIKAGFAVWTSLDQTQEYKRSKNRVMLKKDCFTFMQELKQHFQHWSVLVLVLCPVRFTLEVQRVKCVYSASHKIAVRNTLHRVRIVLHCLNVEINFEGRDVRKSYYPSSYSRRPCIALYLSHETLTTADR